METTPLLSVKIQLHVSGFALTENNTGNYTDVGSNGGHGRLRKQNLCKLELNFNPFSVYYLKTDGRPLTLVNVNIVSSYSTSYKNRHAIPGVLLKGHEFSKQLRF